MSDLRLILFMALLNLIFFYMLDACSFKEDTLVNLNSFTRTNPTHLVRLSGPDDSDDWRAKEDIKPEDYIAPELDGHYFDFRIASTCISGMTYEVCKSNNNGFKSLFFTVRDKLSKDVNEFNIRDNSRNIFNSNSKIYGFFEFKNGLVVLETTNGVAIVYNFKLCATIRSNPHGLRYFAVLKSEGNNPTKFFIYDSGKATHEKFEFTDGWREIDLANACK